MQDPTNVVGRRVGAFVIDSLLLSLVYAFIWQSQAKYVDNSGLGSLDVCDAIQDNEDVSQCLDLGDRTYYITGGKALVVGLIGLALAFLYFVVLQGLTGKTVGKLATGIRTVREDGQVPGIGKALIRWVLLIVDDFPYFIPMLVGFITALTSSGHRRVGDMAAKTFVVAKSAAGQPIAVPGLTTAAGYAPPAWGPAAAPPGAGWGQPEAQQPWGATSQTPPSGTAAPQADPAAAGWATPEAATPSETPASQPAAQPAAQQASTPSAEGPQWDEARGTYIQWDPNQGKWLQWEEAARTWTVIPGQ